MQQHYDPQMAPPARSGSNPWLVGCLIIAVLMLLVGGIGAYFAYHFVRGAMADMGRMVAVEAVRESQLSPDDQDALIVQVDRLAEAFRDGRIGVADLHRLHDRLQQRGTLAYVHLLRLHDDHLAPAIEHEQAVADARLQIDRVGHAMAARQIRDRDIDHALADHFTAHPLEWDEDDWGEDDWGEDGWDDDQPPQVRQRWEPLNELTADDAHQVVDRLRQLADEASVDEQVEPRHIPAEVQEAVDELLGE